MILPNNSVYRISWVKVITEDLGQDAHLHSNGYVYHI